jgi:hypothetical protein
MVQRAPWSPMAIWSGRQHRPSWRHERKSSGSSTTAEDGIDQVTRCFRQVTSLSYAEPWCAALFQDLAQKVAIVRKYVLVKKVQQDREVGL